MFLLCTYTSTVSALSLTLTLALKLDQKVFSSAVCALCPCCPGAVWFQRSHVGGVFDRAFVQISGFRLTQHPLPELNTF